MAQVQKRTAAKRDLVRHYVYLAEPADMEVAERFLGQVDKSFQDLARFPEMGSPAVSSRPELIGLRKWSVAGFEKFLIFYVPSPRGVSIVRVIHASQDWWSLLSVV
jgi:toxin ParE1/3/4